MADVCIIGISGFGNVHYNDLLRQQKAGGVRLLGATVINPEEEVEKCAVLRSLGCQIYTDYREMLGQLGGRADVCFIPTGIHLHCRMTLEALRAGMNVLVEKPAAATVQDVRAMQLCERETGRFVAVGYQTMYAAEALWMKRAILEGRIGALRSIKCYGLWPRPDSYYTRNPWAGRLNFQEQWVLDSPFNNAFAHRLNMICFLAGTEPGKSAELEMIEAELYRAHAIESADTACMRILTRQKVPLYFFVTHSSRETADPVVVVAGEKGTIHWTEQQTRLETPDGIEEFACGDWLSLRNNLVDAVCRRVSDPSTFICGLDIAIAQTICVNGAHDSSPVSEIDPRYICRQPEGQSVKTSVRGIKQDIEQAFKSEKLFSELGVKWARPGKKISLVDYEFFPGGHQPSCRAECLSIF